MCARKNNKVKLRFWCRWQVLAISIHVYPGSLGPTIISSTLDGNVIGSGEVG